MLIPTAQSDVPMLPPNPRGEAGTDVIIGLVAANWPHVRVGTAEIVQCNESDGARTAVRPLAELGALLPVDVVVELVRVFNPVPAPRADESLARLWSERSYQNGSYAFEASIPHVDIHAKGRLTIRVSPASVLALAAVVSPVTAPVAVADDVQPSGNVTG